MDSQATISVRIKGLKGLVTEGTIQYRTWEDRERTLRALKGLGLAWGAAAVAVFIPLLHFVLVPVLLIAGPILAVTLVGQKEIILGGNGICPDCKLAFHIARMAATWPASDICNHCHSRLKIERHSSDQ